MMPVLGRGIFYATAIEQPHSFGGVGIVDEVVSVMLVGGVVVVR